MEVKRSRGLDRGLRLRQFPEWDAKERALLPPRSEASR